MKISVVINTFNAESTLEECLKTVVDFDEIVVCDMYSDDKTLEIAEKYGCKIVMFERMGYAEPARNYAISNATNPWVLVLDADELVTPELREYLYAHIKTNNAAEGLFIPRLNFFMGRFMRSTYPDYQLRLLLKEKAVWPEQVHSRPIIDGKIVSIPKKNKKLAFVHLQDSSIKGIMNKINIYTDKEVVKKKNLYIKLTLLVALLSVLFRFIKHYLIKGGIRDGKAGFVNAMLIALYKFVTVAKVWEYRKKGENNDLVKFYTQHS